MSHKKKKIADEKKVVCCLNNSRCDVWCQLYNSWQDGAIFLPKKSCPHRIWHHPAETTSPDLHINISDQNFSGPTVENVFQVFFNKPTSQPEVLGTPMQKPYTQDPYRWPRPPPRQPPFPKPDFYFSSVLFPPFAEVCPKRWQKQGKITIIRITTTAPAGKTAKTAGRSHVWASCLSSWLDNNNNNNNWRN